MLKIKRVVNGKELEFELTPEESIEFRRLDSVEDGRNIFNEMIDAGFELSSIDYNKLNSNEDFLEDINETMNTALYEDCGELAFDIVSQKIKEYLKKKEN